jgi:YVTN family beta-propeller protein
MKLKKCLLVLCLFTIWACGSRDVPTPEISSVNPTAAQVKSEITITGNNFVDNYSQTFVRFNGANAQGRDFVTIVDSEIVIRVPNAGTSGPLDVTVSDNSSSSIPFTVFGPWAYVGLANGTVVAVDSYNNNINHSYALDVTPDGAVFTPEGDKVYLFNHSRPELIIVDAPVGRILKTIPLSANPVDVAISMRTQHRAFVSHGTSGGITVIDTLTDTVEQVISTGPDPGSLAIDAFSERLFVANRGNNTIQLFLVETLELYNTSATLSGQPEKLLISPANDRLISLNSSAGTVSILTVENAELGADITVGSNPINGAFTAAGDILYVVNNGDNTVSVINLSDKNVTATVAVGAAPYAAVLGSDGLFIFVTNSGASTVTAISVTDNSTVTYNVGNNPRDIGAVVRPNADLTEIAMGRVFVLNQGSGTVSVINILSEAVEATITVGSNPVFMKVESLNIYPPDPQDIVQH